MAQNPTHNDDTGQNSPDDNKSPESPRTGTGNDPETSPEASKDPLLDCLAYLTRHYGRARSPEALTAGLAYSRAGMGPRLFQEAAERIGFKTQVMRKRSINSISKPVLPVVLVLDEANACILMSFDKGKDTARIYSPESRELRDLKLSDLAESYAGHVIYVHPKVDFHETGEAYGEYGDEPTEASKHFWFWGPVLKNTGLYSRVGLAAVLINLFGLASPLFVMNVYDRVLPNNAVETGWALAIGALTIFVFDFLIRNLRSYYVDMAGRRIDVNVTRKAFDQVLNMQIAGKPQSSGAFANMLRDFDAVRDFLASATVTAMVDLPFTLLFLFVIYLLAGPIAFMLGGLILVVLLASLILQVPMRYYVRKSMKSAEAKHGLLVESIYGLETLKALSADRPVRFRYGGYVGENAKLAQKARFYSTLGSNIATWGQQSATVLIVLMGMYQIQNANMTIGALIASVILAGRAMSPIGQVAALMTKYHYARSALNTMKNIMEKPVERPANKVFLHRPDLQGGIKFENVSFSYPSSGRKVLDNVSFDIKPGERVGIAGRIGSGKSTIARLIMGLYQPDEGVIQADGTDTRQIDPADLRRRFAYIAQDVVLFSGSVRDNIAMARPQADESEILAAAKAAGVHDFMAHHPMGYDAPVGERGDAFSGGQKQTIALARAMLLDPVLYLCDEPTNAMDLQTEHLFYNHMKQQSEGRTLVLITHRQSLLPLVDRLILIDQGRVLMDDTRDNVIKALSSDNKVQSKPRKATDTQDAENPETQDA